MSIRGPGDPDKIAVAIKRHPSTQRELARRMTALVDGEFVSEGAVSSWALKARLPAAGNLMKLSKVLGVDVAELL